MVWLLSLLILSQIILLYCLAVSAGVAGRNDVPMNWIHHAPGGSATASVLRKGLDFVHELTSHRDSHHVHPHSDTKNRSTSENSRPNGYPAAGQAFPSPPPPAPAPLTEKIFARSLEKVREQLRCFSCRLEITDTFTDPQTSQVFVHVQQVYKGLPMVNGEAIVLFDSQGQFVHINPYLADGMRLRKFEQRVHPVHHPVAVGDTAGNSGSEADPLDYAGSYHENSDPSNDGRWVVEDVESGRLTNEHLEAKAWDEFNCKKALVGMLHSSNYLLSILDVHGWTFERQDYLRPEPIFHRPYPNLPYGPSFTRFRYIVRGHSGLPGGEARLYPIYFKRDHLINPAWVVELWAPTGIIRGQVLTFNYYNYKIIDISNAIREEEYWVSEGEEDIKAKIASESPAALFSPSLASMPQTQGPPTSDNSPYPTEGKGDARSSDTGLVKADPTPASDAGDDPSPLTLDIAPRHQIRFDTEHLYQYWPRRAEFQAAKKTENPYVSARYLSDEGLAHAEYEAPCSPVQPPVLSTEPPMCPSMSLVEATHDTYVMTTFLHDWFYHVVGVTEANGSFGPRPSHPAPASSPSGGDPVQLVVIKGSRTKGLRLGEMYTAKDGESPIMTLEAQIQEQEPGHRYAYMVDPGVVAHEYTHGISYRLVGGPQTDDCLAHHDGRAVFEAWSDFIPIILSLNEQQLRTPQLTVTLNWWGHPLHRGYYRSYVLSQPGYESNIAVPIHDRIGDTSRWWTQMMLDLYTVFVREFGYDANWFAYGGDGPQDSNTSPPLTPPPSTTGGDAKERSANRRFSRSSPPGNIALIRIWRLSLQLLPCQPNLDQIRNAFRTADQLLYQGLHLRFIDQILFFRVPSLAGGKARQRQLFGVRSFLERNRHTAPLYHRMASATRQVKNKVINALWFLARKLVNGRTSEEDVLEDIIKSGQTPQLADIVEADNEEDRDDDEASEKLIGSYIAPDSKNE
ncbi:hypothetical protein H4R33_002613 [Dimargaris cristalligena]|uniref:Extracellular metalloproteinase n=1 Tax=Dimargaris cristalligena TaxID=215637 RepID=A0A4P9ZVQ7_9FUNG|nr:hypothetical protein H4R33_002613 [Dimargaris cristalligena]RKP36932.1 Fungalysin metallopeptidase-domain-containing protein [Dimargaris cristalligena]|eukprot:RKP36932.1 Fungalysin metallopeptidase-domain-containing protein [Dimargaris cristalligena]